MLLLSSPSICITGLPGRDRPRIDYIGGEMSLSIATWNINSVRLRINNVKRYLRLRKPDVLCLQETKCPDEFFPHKAFEGLGYTHRLVQGMKSYNGVAILSKVPFTPTTSTIAAARRIAGISRSRW